MVYIIIRFPSTSNINLLLFLFACFFTTSWLIPKSLPHKKKEEGKEDGEIVEEKKDKSTADGKAPKLEVGIKVDGKEEIDEELHSHITVIWDQPRRLVNH